MNSVFTPTLSSQCRTALAANSGPLSDRMCSGGPCSDEQVGQALQHIVRPSRRATTMARQRRVNSSITHSMRNVRPSSVRSCTKSYDQTWLGRSGRSRTHDPSVEPQTASFGSRLRHFKPFPAPDPPHALDVHPPALVDQQPSDPSIAVASVLRRQTLDRRRQRGFIIANLRTTTLRRPRLADNRTGTAFRDGNPGAHVLHARALAGGALVFSPPALPSGSAYPTSARRPPP